MSEDRFNVEVHKNAGYNNIVPLMIFINALINILGMSLINAEQYYILMKQSKSGYCTIKSNILKSEVDNIKLYCAQFAITVSVMGVNVSNK